MKANASSRTAEETFYRGCSAKMVNVGEAVSGFIPSASIIQTISRFMIITVVVGIIAYIAYYVWKQRQYIHTVIIQKQFGGNKKMFEFDKARIVTNNGQTEWELQSNKKRIEAPPSKAIEPRNNGTQVAQVALDSQDTWTWLESTIDFSELQEREDYQPAGTQSRMGLLRQMQRNQELRGESFFDKHSALIVSTIAILLVIVANSWAFQQMASPALEVGEQAESIAETQAEVMRIVRDIQTGRNTIPENNDTLNDTGVPI